MNMSIYIARLIGPLFVVSGTALLMARKSYCAMAEEFLASRAVIVLSGFVAMFIGLGIVNHHNFWRPGWPLLVTLTGWLFVGGGAFRMLFPETAKKMGAAMLIKPGLMTGAGLVQLLVGLSLSYAGYALCPGAHMLRQSAL